MNAEQMFEKLGYTKMGVKDGVFFAYERPSNIDGYVERICFNEVIRQFMAEEVYDNEHEYKYEATSKYISLEELVAINTQIAELGWHNSDSSQIPVKKEEFHGIRQQLKEFGWI